MDAELVLDKASIENLSKYKIIKQIRIIHYQFEDYHNTIEYSKKMEGLVYDLLADNPIQLGDFHYLYGSAYWGLDERDSVKHHYEIAAKKYIESRGEDFAPLRYIYDVLGTYAWEADDKRLALEYYNKAGKISSKSERTSDDADKLQAEARALTKEGELQAALKNYEEAFQFRKDNLGTGNPGTIGCINYIVRTMIEMDNLSGARENCQKAIGLYCPGFSPQDFTDNPSHVRNAKSHHYLLDILILKFDILTSSTFDLSENELESAMNVADLCLKTIDHLRKGNRAEETKLYWGKKVLPLYEQILEFYFYHYQASGDDRFAKKAFTLMEKSKGFLLAESIQGINALDLGGVPKEVVDQERALSSQIDDLKKYIYHEEKMCSNADDSKLEIWNSELESLNLNYESFVLKLERDYPKYYQLKYDIADIKISDIQSKLDESEGMLEMFVGEVKTYFVFFTNDSVLFYINSSSLAIENDAKQIHQQIKSQWASLNSPQESWEEFTRAAHSLYQSLLKPIEEFEYSHLTIIPDGHLNYIPLDILLTELPSKDTRDYQSAPYLLKEKSVRYAPSVLYLISTLQKKSKNDKYFGFAPSYPRMIEISQGLASDSLNPLLPVLKFNQDEIKEVSSIFSGISFLGDEATESNFKTKSAQMGILHLAMHTFIDDEKPLHSGFIFSNQDSIEDGILRTSELYTLELNSQLAVLSACNSGFGKMERGEGVMSLARGFSYAGCPSILMSLWECADASTKTIISQFFKTMNEGNSKSESLRLARLDYLKNNSGPTAHPYYWAGLNVIGNDSPIEAGDNTIFYWILGLFLVFVVVRWGIRD